MRCRGQHRAHSVGTGKTEYSSDPSAFELRLLHALDLLTLDSICQDHTLVLTNSESRGTKVSTVIGPGLTDVSSNSCQTSRRKKLKEQGRGDTDLCRRAGGAALGPAPEPQHHGGEHRPKLLATHCTRRCAIVWGFCSLLCRRCLSLPTKFELWMVQDTNVATVPIFFPTYCGKEQFISYHPWQSTNVDVLMATAIPAAGVRWNTDGAVSTQDATAVRKPESERASSAPELFCPHTKIEWDL
ncbi:uncharacterized protein LOC118245418 [Cygnus atratus]|uniref:uncharacterized protein LOC118245418 n=1 Tax=Cygnus atratus TaxID=8868 RepID=UPI0021B7B84A|nr:uncharacterized protein LOC118245418 [Cygnus atratus]